MNAAFWTYLDTLLSTSALVIDRPKGSAHPRYPELIYPLDYGYLSGVIGGDGEGLDVWRGSCPEPVLDAIVCTVDLKKKDVEVKLLVGCTAREKQIVCDFLNDGGYMAAMLVERRE